MKEKQKLVLLVSLIFFHLVLISIQVPRSGRPTFFEKAVFAVFSPVQHGVVSFFQKIGQVWNRYFYLRQVERQNRNLREELFSLRQKNLFLERRLAAVEGAEATRQSLGWLSPSMVIASVIGVDTGQIYKSAVINKGSSDGVKKDMVVLDRKGRLVGRVVDPITLKESRVQLITDEDCGVGIVTERHRVLGVLEGDSTGKCRVKYILRTNREVAVDEEILTSGYDGIYPSGIPVGRIVAISEDASMFKKVLVEPYFDFSELDLVAVVDPESVSRE